LSTSTVSPQWDDLSDDDWDDALGSYHVPSASGPFDDEHETRRFTVRCADCNLIRYELRRVEKMSKAARVEMTGCADLIACRQREIARLMTKLGWVSHGPTARLDKTGPKSTAEHPGGKRPGQDDREFASDLMEREDIRFAYQAKTVGRYERWLASIEERAEGRGEEWLIGKLTELRDDLRETVERWHVSPATLPGDKPTMADSGWKRYVATCGRTVDSLVDEFGCTRQYVKKVQAYAWSAMNLTADEIARRERHAWQRRRLVPVKARDRLRPTSSVHS